MLSHHRPATVGLFILLVGLVLPVALAGQAPQLDYLTRTERVELDRIVIRFHPETGARVRGGELVSLSGAELSSVEQIVASVPGARIERRFGRSEAELDRDRQLGEARTRRSLPDLNLFALPIVESHGSSPSTASALLARDV